MVTSVSHVEWKAVAIAGGGGFFFTLALVQGPLQPHPKTDGGQKPLRVKRNQARTRRNLLPAVFMFVNALFSDLLTRLSWLLLQKILTECWPKRPNP